MKRVFLFLSIGAALAVAAPAVAAPFKGVVVGKQHGVLLVAGSQGAVRAVAGNARVGARVAVSGTRVTTVGRARHAVIRGVVVRRSAGVTFLSAAHHILAVRTGRRLASASATTPLPAITTTTPATTTPLPGAVVQTGVTIGDQGDLAEQDEHQVGQTGQVQVQATVASVAAGVVTLTVNGQTLTINLPSGLTLPASVVGSQVTLNISFAGGQATADQNGQNGQTGQTGQNGDDDQNGDNGNSQSNGDNGGGNGDGND